MVGRVAVVVVRDAREDGADRAAIRELFWEYLQWANEQNWQAFGVRLDIAAMLEEDMGSLGKFAPPGGGIVLALDDAALVGLACLRRLGPDGGEIKRMYVRPVGRGGGVGRALLEALLQRARALGYARVRLDSAGYMTTAHALYRAAGFREIAPYAESEIPEAFRGHWLFMERDVP